MNLLSFLKSSYYSISGKKPFSTGYGAFKNAQILKILKNKNFKLLDIPPSYGIRIDERIIEYPWLFSKLPMDKGNLLDAGSVLNFDYLLSQATLKSKQIVIYTLSPEQNCFFKKGISYHYGDLRDIPYKNQFFDWEMQGFAANGTAIRIAFPFINRKFVHNVAGDRRYFAVLLTSGKQVAGARSARLANR